MTELEMDKLHKLEHENVYLKKQNHDMQIQIGYLKDLFEELNMKFNN